MKLMLANRILLSATLLLGGSSGLSKPPVINKPPVVEVIQSNKQVKPWFQGYEAKAKTRVKEKPPSCSIRGKRAICSDGLVEVSGPAEKEDILKKKREVSREQYDFLEEYLGFRPKGKIRIEYLGKEDFLATCGDAVGCMIDYSAYWRADDIDPHPEIGDHEMNHAFVSDIRLDPDFNEAVARYLTMKEDQYVSGRSLKQITKRGMFYTGMESRWLKPSFKQKNACKKLMDETDIKQCKALFWLVINDAKNILPRLLKQAFEGQIDLEDFCPSAENPDAPINTQNP